MHPRTKDESQEYDGRPTLLSRDAVAMHGSAAGSESAFLRHAAVFRDKHQTGQAITLGVKATKEEQGNESESIQCEGLNLFAVTLRISMHNYLLTAYLL